MTDKEPANKDLEEEIGKYIYSIPHSADGFWPKDIDCYSQEARIKYGVYHYWSYEQVRKIAHHFAEWQKQQMKEALQTEYEKGRFDMREEMMKDAVDGEYWDGSIYLDNRPTEYKDGDKVKIIIVVKIITVKEEQQ